jgi:hypothetical protein
MAGGRMIECIDEDFFSSSRIAQEVEPDRWVEATYPISLARVGSGWWWCVDTTIASPMLRGFDRLRA